MDVTKENGEAVAMGLSKENLDIVDTWLRQAARDEASRQEIIDQLAQHEVIVSILRQLAERAGILMEMLNARQQYMTLGQKHQCEVIERLVQMADEVLSNSA